MSLLIFTGYGGFTYRTHSISRLILKEFKNLKISKIVFGKNNFKFLQNQKEVNYEKLINIDSVMSKTLLNNKDYSEDEIEDIEKSLGASLTKLAYSERTLVRHTHDIEYSKKLSHKDIINFVCALIENIEQVVIGKKIILVYTSASLISEILYYLSIKHKIKFYAILEIRYLYAFWLAENNKEYVGEIFDNFSNATISSAGVELFNDYLNRIKKSNQSLAEKEHILRVHKHKELSLKNILRFFSNFIFNPEGHFMSPNRLQRLKYNIIYYFRAYYQKKISFKIIPKNKYVYYPLATIPEASTLIRAIDFYDELSNIKQISLNIPINFKLVIKLHPNMKGKNSIKFLKDIKKIFNVIVLDYSVPSYEVMKNSECVIVTSGTTGLESLALGKKTVIVGNPSYSYLKSCFKIKSFSELEKILKIEWDKNLVEIQTNELKMYASKILNYKIIEDKNRVIWNNKSFTTNTLDFDISFFNIFKDKLKNIYEK
jgi:hypothetical protein